MKLRFFLPFLTVLAAGCSVNPRPSFDETARDIRTRTGLEAGWIRTSADDAAAIARVRDWLREPLTPRRAAQIALVNNRSLQAKLEGLGVAQASLARAQWPGNPEFDVLVGWPSGSATEKLIDVGFGIDVLDLFLIPSRKRLAGLELTQAKALAADEILHVSAQAQNALQTLQATEADLAAASAALEIEEALAEFAEARRKAGNLGDLEYEEELAKRDALRGRRDRLKIEALEHREQVNRALSLSGDLTQWVAAPLEAELPAADPADAGLEALALSRRFDIAAARAATELLESALGLQRKTRLLPAGAHVGVRREAEGTHRVTGPSLSLQLPILNPGRAESARLEALHFQTVRLLEDRQARAQSEVREARRRLSTAREMVRHYALTLLPRKKRIVELTQAHYNMMLKGADELLRAKRDEFETQMDLTAARRDYWTARVDLALALGGAIPESNQGEGK